MAATLTGTIKVNVGANYGEFAGIYTGDFTYDNTHLTKVGTETMTINGDNGNPYGDRAGLLSLNFRFLDFATGSTLTTYTLRDDFNFPTGPVLAFENGIPTQFSFIVDPGNNGGIWTANNGFMFADPGTFHFGVRGGAIGGDGIVTLSLNDTSVDPEPTPTTEPPSVPESSSPFTSFLAALGLGIAYLWRKLRKIRN
ncbi:MAG: hypothetical protein HC916_05365 [Coleofasciculaceae cyanobacterium SM2_1_6]|nr:hypothetical protein [Coleofasciculaceae cyanobacterium SM2_1_6]